MLCFFVDGESARRMPRDLLPLGVCAHEVREEQACRNVGVIHDQPAPDLELVGGVEPINERDGEAVISVDEHEV